MEGTLTLHITATPEPIRTKDGRTLYQSEFRTSMDKEGDTFSLFLEEEQYNQLVKAEFGTKVMVRPVMQKDYRTQGLMLRGFSSLKVEARQPAAAK